MVFGLRLALVFTFVIDIGCKFIVVGGFELDKRFKVFELVELFGVIGFCEAIVATEKLLKQSK